MAYGSSSSALVLEYDSQSDKHACRFCCHALQAVNALLLDAGGGTHPLSLTFMDVKGGGVIGSGTFGCVLEFQLYSDPDGMLDINRTHTQHRQQCQAEQLWLEQINDFKKERLVIKVPEQPDELQLPSQQLSRDTAGRQLSRLLGGRQSIQLPLEQLQQHNTRAMPIPPKLHALWHEFCVLVSLEKEDFTCRPLGVVLMPLPLDPEGPGPAAAGGCLGGVCSLLCRCVWFGLLAWWLWQRSGQLTHAHRFVRPQRKC